MKNDNTKGVTRIYDKTLSKENKIKKLERWQAILMIVGAVSFILILFNLYNIAVAIICGITIVFCAIIYLLLASQLFELRKPV